MMRWISLLLLLLPLAVAPAARNDKPVSLVIDDAPVAQVLQALAEMNHKNLVVAPDVSGTLSLRLQKVPWSQALRAVADSAGLSLQQQGTVIYAHTQAWQKANQAQREAEQEKRLQNLPLQAESVTLHFADAEELAKSGGKLLSARGHLMADKRTNRLLIRDDARHLPALKAWAQEMDLPVGQVELAAHIVSMSETSLRELGVKWRLAEAGSPPGSGQITTLSSDVSVNDASTRAGFNIGKINGRLLELELSALERKQQVEIIASPRLLASHMQPASIKQGSEIPYQVSSGESGATSVEFKEAVLGMEVTPTVLQQGRVRLKLRISENTPGQVLKQENGEALAIDKQEIETLVEVRSGETLALGGIFSQKTKPPATASRCLAISRYWDVCFVVTGKIMNVANWLSLLRHGFWQYVKQVFMLNTFQVFDVRTDLAYKGYRFESRVRHQSSLYCPAILFSCQTSRSIEIIFSLTLALLHMRFQFMPCGAGCLRSGFIINE